MAGYVLVRRVNNEKTVGIVTFLGFQGEDRKPLFSKPMSATPDLDPKYGVLVTASIISTFEGALAAACSFEKIMKDQFQLDVTLFPMPIDEYFKYQHPLIYSNVRAANGAG